MGFDIRLPIGMMYTRHSLGINVNLWWGIVMLMFGAGMLLLARRGALAARAADKTLKDHVVK